MTKILGQEVETLKNQILAIIFNVYSWVLSLIPFGLGSSKSGVSVTEPYKCVSIGGPGGLDVLQVKAIPGHSGATRATVGYNLPGLRCPFACIDDLSSLPNNYVLVKNSYFSVNYADVCIRWG